MREMHKIKQISALHQMVKSDSGTELENQFLFLLSIFNESDIYRNIFVGNMLIVSCNLLSCSCKCFKLKPIFLVFLLLHRLARGDPKR